MKLKPHHHQYRNILFLAIGLIFTFFLCSWPPLHHLLLSLKKLGYLSAFIGGMLFVSTFTFATGSLIILTLSNTLSPLWVILIAGLGAATFDFLIFKFVKNKVDDDVQPIFEQFLQRHHFRKIIHTHYFAWTLPVIGVFIMLSPLPDELGVSLVGLSKMNPTYFIVISFLSHLVGISTILFAGKMI